jgi:hypothetical protein
VTWRSPPLAVIAAVVGLLAGSALAAAVPAIAAPTPASARAPVQVPASGAGKPWRISDPAAYARAVRSGDWVFTPEGLAYKTCVNHVPTGGKVAPDGNIITRSGAVQRVVRCTTPTLDYPGSGRAQTASGGSAGGVASSTSCEAGDQQWWAETCALDPAGLTTLSEQFSMPSNPQKNGALIFFFPAFDDSTGNAIVQPVLSWGANAKTGVTSDNVWYLTSWYVDGGTSYVSNSAHVNPPGTVVGKIQRGLCELYNTNCDWTITTTVGSTSVGLFVMGGPDMTQVNGGVMEVPRANGCVETPPTGQESFWNLSVNDTNGSYTPTFQHYTVNPQCSVTSAHSSGINTDITWTP